MSLDQHRREVDRIDREMLRLLGERLEVARAIGEAKLKSGAPVYAPQREEQVLSALVEAAPNIPASGVRSVFREVISLSIGAQMAKPVAYLGPEGSFTQQAQLRAFGSSVPSLPLRSISDIFAAVESGEASYGVVPVENSTEGVVSHSLDLLAESELKVVAQVTLAVEQCLVGFGSLDAVTRVLSKDIALAQCRGWLSRHAPNATLVETDSTAAAVEQVAREPQGAAAVPTMKVSDVESGRSAAASTPLAGNQQAFSPEMAQNGGALVGNTMFAFDGMLGLMYWMWFLPLNQDVI
jgi:chorismate mutase/prephenate dehydratase